MLSAIARMTNGWRKGPQWPETVQASASTRRLAAVVVLFFVPRSISEMLMSLVGAPRNVETFPQGLALTGLVVVTAAATLALLQLMSGVRVRDLLGGGRPSVGQILKWAGWGAFLGGHKFISNLSWGFRTEEPWYGALVFTAVVTECVLYPLIEEPIYRGVALPALARATGSRSLAYLGSAALYTISHAPSHTALVLHGTLGLPWGGVVMLMFIGLLTAHAYWTTGKLSLGMLMHGVFNGTTYLALATGYLIRFLGALGWRA